MKLSRQDSKNAPSKKSATPPQAPKTEAEELGRMWDAIAALLDDTTVQPGSKRNQYYTTPSTASPQADDAAQAYQFGDSPRSGNAGEPPAQRPLAPNTPTADSSPGANVGPQLLPAPDQANPAGMPVQPLPPTAKLAVSESSEGGAAPMSSGYVPPAEAFVARSEPARPLRTPGDPFELPAGLDYASVFIRGRAEGITIEMGAGRWDDLLYLLSYRIEQTGGLFRNSPATIEVGGRQLNEPELHDLRTVMATYGMQPSEVRTSSERSFAAAVALGYAATLIGADGNPVNEARSANTDGDGHGAYFIYRGSLRSGQILTRAENILLIGDVNPGAEVNSDGDILVWGRMRGIAHAGANGNRGSIVAAFDLDPVQLRIDQVVAASQAGQNESGPRWGSTRAASRRPEIARLVDGRLTIEAWDEAKSAGAPLLKRRPS
jgi:septum site-determining protein MinC